MADVARGRFVTWRPCSAVSCLGQVIDDAGYCLLHSPDNAAIKKVWDDLSGGKAVEFPRGLDIDEELMTRIIDRAPVSGTRRVFADIDFTAAQLPRVAMFRDATFGGVATFTGARCEYAQFTGAQFQDFADFAYARFDEARFLGVQFKKMADFSESWFERLADFREASFAETAFSRASLGEQTHFERCRFREEALFNRAAFRGFASFRDAQFESASFAGCAFLGEVVLDKASFGGVADFRDSSFGRSISCYQGRFVEGLSSRNCGLPERVEFPESTIKGDSFDLTGVVCRGYLDVECETKTVECKGSRFLGGGHLRSKGSRINVIGAEFPVPFIISGDPGLETRPKLDSLEEANVTGLVLVGIDVSACTFAYVHNLDQLRLGQRNEFGYFPSASRRYRRRPILADEVLWRVFVQPAPKWRTVLRKDRVSIDPTWALLWNELRNRRGDLETADDDERRRKLLDPSALAELYRSLRKGREDNKDEPGAADFYYSEMEMRRISRESPLAERILLSSYKVLSGYGLRATRSLIALLVIMLVAAWLLSAIPMFSCGTRSCVRPYADALVYSIETALGVFRAPEVSLSLPGRAIQVCLRVIGPLLLGLSIVAVRGRVKR